MTILKEEFEIKREELESYLDALSNIGIVLIDSARNIQDCNQGFIRMFQLHQKPIGSPLVDFLTLGDNDLKQAEEIKLFCNHRSGVSGHIYCRTIETESGCLLFCERLMLTESRAIEQIGIINNELINLQRQSVKKNLLLEKLRQELDERIAELEAALARTKQAEEALRESEERYRELSIIDGLTQLHNSRYFYQQLTMEIDRVNRYREPLTIILLDVDNFKAFNDAHGHIEGDRVLSRLGQVVKRCLRQTDSAYRYGGEEFTIIMPVTKCEDGAVTAERIRTEFKKEMFSPASARDTRLTVSIGLAQYHPQEDVKAFVHRVDQLMYQAKKEGKDRVCS